MRGAGPGRLGSPQLEVLDIETNTNSLLLRPGGQLLQKVKPWKVRRRQRPISYNGRSRTALFWTSSRRNILYVPFPAYIQACSRNVTIAKSCRSSESHPLPTIPSTLSQRPTLAPLRTILLHDISRPTSLTFPKQPRQSPCPPLPPTSSDRLSS